MTYSLGVKKKKNRNVTIVIENPSFDSPTQIPEQPPVLNPQEGLYIPTKAEGWPYIYNTIYFILYTILH